MAVNEKIRFKIKGYDHATVDIAAAKIVEAAKRSGARVSGPIPLPTDKEVVTILRAVHKYKDSREQFEMRTHKRLIDVFREARDPRRRRRCYGGQVRPKLRLETPLGKRNGGSPPVMLTTFVNQ